MSLLAALPLAVLLFGGLVCAVVFLARPKQCSHTAARTFAVRDGATAFECEACGEIVWSDAR